MEKEILQKNDKKILLVENIIKKSNNLLTKKDLEKKLYKKMSLEELEEILYYLEEKGKILVGEKGIVWIYNESPKLKKAIEEGLEV